MTYILDTDAERFGELKAELETRGESLDDADLFLAAATLVGDGTLVTANTRHFRRVPDLSVTNWLEEDPG